MHGSRGELSLGSELSVWVVRSAVTPWEGICSFCPLTLGCGAICLVHTAQGDGQHWGKEENTSFINQDGQGYICTGGSWGSAPGHHYQCSGVPLWRPIPGRAEWFDLQGCERQQWHLGTACCGQGQGTGSCFWARKDLVTAFWIKNCSQWIENIY